MPEFILYGHDAYHGYPNKVYDYAEEYFRSCKKIKLKILRYDIRYYKGYLVPISTLKGWHNYMKLLGRIPRGRVVVK